MEKVVFRLRSCRQCKRRERQSQKCPIHRSYPWQRPRSDDGVRSAVAQR
ncbi:hypothetical protein HNQ96_004663 [Aminobacter lissarensis]|uniref:Uncharacterized protein n=1 Tax=Aminobacter carboxidus TaxID=376165 RepID=A0A8E1WK19_9HYPH|nr:hypothetical protein [Aminobacter lissarensis]